MASARLRNAQESSWSALLARVYPLYDAGIPAIVFHMGAITDPVEVGAAVQATGGCGVSGRIRVH